MNINFLGLVRLIIVKWLTRPCHEGVRHEGTAYLNVVIYDSGCSVWNGLIKVLRFNKFYSTGLDLDGKVEEGDGETVMCVYSQEWLQLIAYISLHLTTKYSILFNIERFLDIRS